MNAQDWDAFHTSEAQRREWTERLGRIEHVAVLDAPGEAHPILVLKLDALLTEMLFLSDGAIASYEAAPEIVRPDVDHSNAMARALAEVPEYNHSGRSAKSKMPKSSLADDLSLLRGEFDRQRTNRQRLLVIKAVQTMVIRAQYAPRVEMCGTDEWKEAVAQDPRSCRVVAEVFRTSYDTVRRIKKEAGTLASQGRPRKDALLAVA